jgi:peptidoglycan LD-endopeptidase LytH
MVLWGLLTGTLISADSEFDTRETRLLGEAFFQLQNNIRLQAITPDSAQRRFQEIVTNFRQVTAPVKSEICTDSLAFQFVFPVKGYTPNAIGGRGKGYFDRTYNMFDHSVTGSHPAQDIFIRDINQDSKSDYTQLPTDVVAMRPGIVVGLDTTWQPGSLYRGGNFVWIYDPCMDGLFYYAHNSKVVVQMGEKIALGQKIAEVGRTGLNAYKSRSDTHLHLMYLQLSPEGLPKPVNTYDWLVSAQPAE